MELVEKIIIYTEKNGLETLSLTILSLRPYAVIVMMNLLESSFFNYSLRFDDDYEYLWKVLE